MQFPFIGPSSVGRSNRSSVQDTINMYFEPPAENGRPALVSLPGLLRRIVVPKLPANYPDDYTDLLGFRSPYEVPLNRAKSNTGVFTMTSTITEFQTGSQTIEGTLSGMSSSIGELLYSSFNLYFFAFRDHYELYDTLAVDATAASGTWTWSKSVDFGTDLGVKVVLLGKPGTGATVSSGNSSAKTVTVTGADLTGTTDSTSFYYGQWALWTGRTGVDDRLFQVLHSSYDGADSTVFLKESVDAGTMDGTITPIEIYGEVFPLRHMIRSMNVPRMNKFSYIESGDIVSGRKYIVVGDACSVEYDSNDYGIDEPLGDMFIGTDETDYVRTNPGWVIEKDKNDFFLDFGYKTLIADQALALIVSCANGQQTDAENLLLQLIACQQPLGDIGPQSGSMGNFGHIYNTHGHNRLAYAITGVNQTAHTIEISGDATAAKEFSQYVTFAIEGSTANDATGYTVASSSHLAGTVTITVDDSIQDLLDAADNVDGDIVLYKTTVPYTYFRTSSSMTVAIALLFYMEKYPSGTGTYYNQAKAAVIKLLDHMVDTYLITTAGSKQVNLFRDGRGTINRRNRHRVVDSNYLLKSASSEANLLAWWAFHMANEQNLTTASTLGTAYGTLATNLYNRLFNDKGHVTHDGLYDPLNKRIFHGIAGFDVLELNGSTIRVNGNAVNIFLVDSTVSIKGNSVSANDTTYTVASVVADTSSVSSGSIAAGIWYKVIGNITYNGINYVGAVGNYSLFKGVSGVTTYTDNATSTVTKYEMVITVDETVDTNVAYTVAGDGVLMIHNLADSLLANVLYMTFLGESDELSRAREIANQLVKYEQNPDETYPQVGGMAPVLGCITDTYINTGEYFSGVDNENCRYPWSLAYIYLEQESVSVASTMMAALGFASVNDYDRFQKYFDFVYVSRPYSDEGYIHTTSEYVEPDFEELHFAFLQPSIEYRMQSWAAAKDTAWALIAQKPNGLFGIVNTATTVSGRSRRTEVRNCIRMKDKLYAVIGNIVVAFDKNYDWTLISSTVIATDEGWVDMVSNGYQLLITDGTTIGYLYDSELNTWNILSDTGDADNSFVGGGSAAYLDGYFFTHYPDSNIITYSNYYAPPNSTDEEGNNTYNEEGYKGGLVWNPLNRIVASVSPGNIVKVLGAYRYLWVFKEKSVQVHRNTGDTTDQFALIPGSEIEYGCAAAGSVVAADNSVFFLSHDAKVRKFNGFTPQIVSANNISIQLERMTNKSNARAFSYENLGKTFYQITFPENQKTFLYVITDSGSHWVKRASYLSYSDDDGRHRANCYAFFNDMHFMGDYENGWIYSLESDVYTDNDKRIRKVRVCQPIPGNNDRNSVEFKCLEIIFEAGVGLINGQGSDPQAMLRYSNDCGKTWSNEYWKSIGKIGEYSHRTRWFRLGSARIEDRAFELVVSDPIKLVISDAFLNPEE